MMGLTIALDEACRWKGAAEERRAQLREGQAALQGSLDRAEKDLAATLGAAAEETWRWASFLAEWQERWGTGTGGEGAGEGDMGAQEGMAGS